MSDQPRPWIAQHDHDRGWHDKCPSCWAARLAEAAPLASETTDADPWSEGYDKGFAAAKRLCDALDPSRPRVDRPAVPPSDGRTKHQPKETQP